MADDVKNTFVCPTCKACASEGSWVSRKDLNRLLIHTCERLKERLPLRLTDRQVPSKCSYVSGDRSASGSGGKGSFTWVVDEEQQWRVDFLLYRTVDIASMESKARQRQYTTLAEFEADAATIVHNVVIYHGVNSIIADMSRQMLRDCLYDLAEMRQCQDCYRRSNEKTNKHWFCLPCNPPHMLVYAKQKGYPYWPAKVIRVEDDMYDVRFFGAPHERAKLEKTHIRDITVDLAALGVKRSAGFNKACEELRRHQQLLAKGPRANSPMSSSDEAERDQKGQSQPQRTKRGRQKSEKESEEESDSEKSPPAKRKRVRKSAAETPVAAVPKRRGRRSTAAAASVARRKSAQKQKPANGEDAEDESSGDEESVSSTSQQHVPSKEDDDQVSSSCTVPRSRCVSVQTPPRFNRDEAPRKRRQSRDKDAEMAELRRECEREKAAALAVATRQHELELERVQNEYNQELMRIEERHRIALAESKRKQWCYNCEAEAIYHCCWNTAYCSTECQQSHWHKEHKRLCRRKR
ncbi:hypothetical protein B566_EDAN004930 [Ephemera danica]|nr:hypothetical protein B566_EDAN004930 [Ephemera danica]